MTTPAKRRRARAPPSRPVAAKAAGAARALAIGDLAREFALTTRAIRFYEARGLLKPSRQGSNRCFGPEDRHRLALIVRAKNLVSLEEIAEQLALFDAAAIAAPVTTSHRLSADRQIAALLAKRADLAATLGDLRRIRARFALIAGRPPAARG